MDRSNKGRKRRRRGRRRENALKERGWVLPSEATSSLFLRLVLSGCPSEEALDPVFVRVTHQPHLFFYTYSGARSSGRSQILCERIILIPTLLLQEMLLLCHWWSTGENVATHCPHPARKLTKKPKKNPGIETHKTLPLI